MGPPNYSNAYSLNAELLFSEVDKNGLEIIIFCDQRNLVLGGSGKPFYRDFVIDARDDNLILAGNGGAVNRQKISVEDPGINHAVARNSQ